MDIENLSTISTVGDLPTISIHLENKSKTVSDIPEVIKFLKDKFIKTCKLKIYYEYQHLTSGETLRFQFSDLTYENSLVYSA